jgi:hypothetical protein
MSFLGKHNPEVDWRGGELVFSCCACTCQVNFISPSEEDLDALNMPHLEDQAQENYSQLSNESWGSDEQAAFFTTHSHDPVAHHLRGIMEEKFDEDTGTVDKDYWSQHVPPHLHLFGDVFSKTSSERMPL